MQLVGQGREAPLVALWCRGAGVIPVMEQEFYSRFDPRIFFK